MILAFEGKITTLKAPVTGNEYSGKQSTMAFTISAQNWGASMRKFTEQVKKWKVGQVTMIILLLVGTY